MTKNHISVVIPTYHREKILLDTIHYLLEIEPPPDEILIMDQTLKHEAKTLSELTKLNKEAKIKWVKIPKPSIPHAMNFGLEMTEKDIVLFLDDDIIPDNKLIASHLAAYEEEGVKIVAGRVLQPWDQEASKENQTESFKFSSNKRQWITEIMAGNFSIKRRIALDLGGFDENFVRVAYRFELEFAERAMAAGERILFEPEALIRHLRVSQGGTRSYGEYLKTLKPSHSVGAYYYFLHSKRVRYRFLNILRRLILSVKTKYHFRNPWWIPITIIAELLGIFWAIFLFLRGPRLINWNKKA